MSYATEVTADTPLLYWQLDDPSGTTAADSSGNSRTGTYNNGVTLGASGARADGNKAVSLDGTDDNVSSSYNPFTAASSRTYEIVYNRTNSSTLDQLWGDSNTHVALRLASGSTNIDFYFDTGLGPETWTSASPGTGQWVHCVLLANDSAHTAELYINAVSKGQKTGTATMSTSASNVQVGGTGSGNYFIGGLDEFAIYSGLLSSARITAHYNALTLLDSPLWSVH